MGHNKRVTRITCCKDCKKRELGCHDKCKEYINQSKELKRGREIERKIREKFYV